MIFAVQRVKLSLPVVSLKLQIRSGQNKESHQDMTPVLINQNYELSNKTRNNLRKSILLEVNTKKIKMINGFLQPR